MLFINYHLHQIILIYYHLNCLFISTLQSHQTFFLLLSVSKSFLFIIIAPILSFLHLNFNFNYFQIFIDFEYKFYPNFKYFLYFFFQMIREACLKLISYHHYHFYFLCQNQYINQIFLNSRNLPLLLLLLLQICHKYTLELIYYF